MSTLRINNIEAKSVPASPTLDEKIKLTNSSGDVLVHVDGKTSGITTIGINTTAGNITFDANSNVVVTGIITATKFVGTIEPTNLTVSGDLTIPDKIIHSGDTNTAIRFPAADTITAETGGSERLRIDSSGNLSLGTSTSIQKFTIDNGGISLDNGWNTQWGVNASRAYIQGEDANGNNRLILGTSNTERLRINSSGNMSLGGLDPVPTSTAYNTASFHIHQTTNATNKGAQIHLTTANKGSAGSDGAQVSQYNGSLYINNQDDGDTYFYNNGSPTATIKANGSFGIGTQSPADKLVVDGTTDFKSNSYIGGDLYMYGSSYSKGIFLGGSGSDYKLDYYRKGSWTPQMWRSGVNSEVTVGSGNRFGRYVRIGNLLHISFYWYNPSLSQSSGTTWVVRNLPFNLEIGTTAAYQFIPGGYYYFENQSGYGDSSTGGGMLRWQANGTFSNNTLTLYSDNNSRNANGAVEFSGTGTLVLP